MEYFYEDKDMIKGCERAELIEKCYLIFILFSFFVGGCVIMMEYFLGGIITWLLLSILPICRLVALKEGTKKRIYPTKNATLAISKRGIILRGKRYLWKDIDSVKIENTGSYRNRLFIRPNFKLFCQCAYFKTKRKVETLDLGYNFLKKDKQKIIQLLKENYPKIDIR